MRTRIILASIYVHQYVYTMDTYIFWQDAVTSDSSWDTDLGKKVPLYLLGVGFEPTHSIEYQGLNLTP